VGDTAVSETAAAQARPQELASGFQWGPVLKFGLRFLIAAGIVVLVPFLLNMQWRGFQLLFSPANLPFLSLGLLATILVSLISILISLPMAMALALGRLSNIKYIKWPSIAIIEVIRALPLLLLIFYIYLRFPGLDLFRGLTQGNPTDYLPRLVQIVLSPTGIAMIFALTLYTAAVNAELLRSGILSLERGQTEAARSLGLTYWQTMRRVILPQAFRRTLAPLIAQFTILVKDTSLGSIIGFIELQRSAQIIVSTSFNLLEAAYVVAIIYFVVNYLLGQVIKVIERLGPSVERPVEI
jgi:His/Glu/Gln/Arg/opine family amino acid ABC transporter permease subunit